MLLVTLYEKHSSSQIWREEKCSILQDLLIPALYSSTNGSISKSSALILHLQSSFAKNVLREADVYAEWRNHRRKIDKKADLMPSELRQRRHIRLWQSQGEQNWEMFCNKVKNNSLETCMHKRVDSTVKVDSSKKDSLKTIEVFERYDDVFPKRWWLTLKLAWKRKPFSQVHLSYIYACSN